MPSEAPRAAAAGLAGLFRDRTTLWAVTGAVLEGRLGAARCDDPADPRVARLDIGCYAIFGGDPALEAARALVASVDPPRELCFPDDEAWRRLLHEVHVGLDDRSMRSFATDALDPSRLAFLSGRLPQGFVVRPVNPAIAASLGPELQPHAMQVFDDPEDFARRGLGFCATSGNTVACAATSYAVCSGAIELAIATHPAFRRRGLARAVAARLMLECLERELIPHWNAANPVSQRLAVELGYRPAEICEVLYLEPGARTGNPASCPSD